MLTSRIKLQIVQMFIQNLMILFFPIAIISGIFFVFSETVSFEIVECLEQMNLRGKEALFFMLNSVQFSFKNAAILLCNLVLFLFLFFQRKNNWKDAFYKTSLLGVVQLIIYVCYHIATENRINQKPIGNYNWLNYYFDSENIFYAWYIPFGFIAIYYLIALFKKLIEIIKNRYF